MAATMLGRGLYDASELGKLLGRDAGWVVRMATTSSRGSAVVPPSFDPMFSFVDLVALRVARRVLNRGVSDLHLRRGVHALRERSGAAQPLGVLVVIESLATCGTSLLSNLGSGEYEDIGRGRQGVFQEVIGIDLTKVTFDAHGEPTRWLPTEGIVLDPAIQAGAPCIAGTRVPTATVAQRAATEEVEDIAFDLELDLDQILRALTFEQRLEERGALAA